MMKFYSIALCALLFACNESKNEDSALTKTATASISSGNDLTPGCYQMIIGRDSANMELTRTGADSVMGTLVYNRFEKDDNSGNFVGKVDSNKIVGWYKFSSEGVITVRQVIFKVVGDKLAEAYGDINAKGDTAYFPYPQTLNFEETHPYKKIPCP